MLVRPADGTLDMACQAGDMIASFQLPAVCLVVEEATGRIDNTRRILYSSRQMYICAVIAVYLSVQLT